MSGAKQFEIGGNALAASIVTVITLSATAIGLKYLDDNKKLKMIKADIPVKDNVETTVDFDLKTGKTKLIRKATFEITETKTIIKEVPVVPGFKKMKKVKVQLDKDGVEIPGTEVAVSD